jgi:hypothetical protein
MTNGLVLGEPCHSHDKAVPGSDRAAYTWPLAGASP